MHTKDQLGIDGESYAARYLVGAGFMIVTCNWRCPAGEIDIIAMDGDTLVLIEVKTRTSRVFGAPYEAVTWVKAEKIRSLAVQYLRENPHRGSVRFDVISIVKPKNCQPELEHIRAAF
jgi:putative endonuclease